MPESNAAAKRRQQKANRAMGIGDAHGRLVRVKDPPKTSLCQICKVELTITKSNAELIAHAESKHSSTVEMCFPGASEISAELAAAHKAKGSGASSKNAGGLTKAQRKAKEAAAMDDLLAAGLSPKTKKKK